MKKGMIKVSILYPNGEGKKFDIDYYCSKHLPLVAGLMGDTVKGATVEKGVAGGVPGAPAPFAAMGNIYFDSIQAYQEAFGPNAEKLMGDLPNFTDIEPVIQISEVEI